MALRRTPDRVEALRWIAEGGVLRRVAHDMVLSPLPPSPSVPGAAAARIGPLAAAPEELAPAAASSVPPGHVDHDDRAGAQERVDYWRRLLEGRVCGPLLPWSRQVLDRDGDLGAALVLTRMPAAAWWAGGPWVAELFVVPALQRHGLGEALLAGAISDCAAAGETRLGLTVTDRNPARRLYEQLGFRRFRTLYVVAVGPWPA